MKIDADGWGYRHGEVVAQAIETDAFVAAAGWQYVDGTGAVGHGDGSKGTAMQGAANGEHQDGAGGDVACKEDGEG